MSTEENTALVRSVFEEAVNSGNATAIKNLYAPNCGGRGAWPGQPPGTVGLRDAVDDLRAAFPDLHLTIEHVAAGGDYVATCETWHGTHAPTGEAATGRVVRVVRIEGGKIVDEWSDGWDWLARPVVPPTPGQANA